MIKKIILIIAILFSVVTCFGYTPPTGSPLDDEVHPRIFFIPEASSYTVGVKPSVLRSLITTDSDYKTFLQDYIDDLDGHYTYSYAASDKLNRSFDSIGFALLYILDADTLAGSPYNMSFTYSTAQYGAKAIAIALALATGQSGMTQIESYGSDANWSDYREYNYGEDDDYGPINFAQAVVADWCNDLITTQQKHDIIDGIYNAYTYSYPESNSISVFAEGKFYGKIHNGIGYVAFYGDSDLDAGHNTKLETLADKMEEWWVDSFKALHNQTMGGGTNDFEGTLYNHISVKNSIPGIIALSTAWEENLFDTITYLKYLPQYRVYEVNPRIQTSTYYAFGLHDVGHKNMDINWEYGNLISEINPITYFLNMAGETDLAGVHNWYADTSGFVTGSVTSNIRYTDIYKALCWDDDITEKTPAQAGLGNSVNMGNGRYFLRTGFTDPTDTVIIFNAREWYCNDGGHGHRDIGAFEIYKYGDATTRRQIAKDFLFGSAGSRKTRRGLWYNTITVDDGTLVDTEYYGGFRESYATYEIDPTDAVWDEGGDADVGEIISDTFDTDFDHIDYDFSNAWADAKVTYAERELVYSRTQSGTNDEYVVIYDRVESASSAAYKYFKLMCPWEPTLLDNGDSPVSMSTGEFPGGDTSGIWTEAGTIANKVKLDNTYSANASHSRIFLRSVYPDSVSIHKVGGPDHYWEDARGALLKDLSVSGTHTGADNQSMLTDSAGGFYTDALIGGVITNVTDGSTGTVTANDGTTATATLSGGTDNDWDTGDSYTASYQLGDKEKNYRGQYSIWVQPATGSTYNNMLNVIQIGSTSTAESSTILTAMTDVAKVTGTTGSTGGLIGAHIKDTTKNRVILFNDQKRATQAVQLAPYSYTITVTANSHHLLTNITANTEYTVSDGDETIASPTSNSDGVLEFQDSTNSSGEFTYTISADGGEENSDITVGVGPVVNIAVGPVVNIK